MRNHPKSHMYVWFWVAALSTFPLFYKLFMHKMFFVFKANGISTSIVGHNLFSTLFALAIAITLILTVSRPQNHDFQLLSSKSLALLPLTTCVLIAVVGLAKFIGEELYSHLFPGSGLALAVKNLQNETIDMSPTAWLWIVVAFGPILEEIIFRHVLMRMWVASFGFIAALVAQNVLFVIQHIPLPADGLRMAHFSLLDAPAILIAGIFYSYARIKHSLLYAILLHSAYNLGVTFFQVHDSGIWMFLLGSILIPVYAYWIWKNHVKGWLRSRSKDSTFACKIYS